MTEKPTLDSSALMSPDERDREKQKWLREGLELAKRLEKELMKKNKSESNKDLKPKGLKIPLLSEEDEKKEEELSKVLSDLYENDQKKSEKEVNEFTKSLINSEPELKQTSESEPTPEPQAEELEEGRIKKAGKLLLKGGWWTTRKTYGAGLWTGKKTLLGVAGFAGGFVTGLFKSIWSVIQETGLIIKEEILDRIPKSRFFESCKRAWRRLHYKEKK